MTPELIPVIEAAGAALATLIALGVGFLIRWIYSKTKSSLVERALTAVSQACHLAATQVFSTYVEELKLSSADGTLTDEEKATARAKAIAMAKGYLGPKGIALIVKGLGIESEWLDSFLGASLESSIAAIKRVERESWSGVDQSWTPPAKVNADPTSASAQA